MDRIVDINLIEETISKDEFLQEVKTFNKVAILAEIKSVYYKEFYTAKSMKFEPSIVFVIKNFEYENQNKVEYAGKLYRVIRTYLTKYDDLELICEVSNEE